MHVVRTELPVPQQLASLEVERHHRVRIEVGAGPDVPVEIGRRIADRQIKPARLRVEGRFVR
jgi:hypothetical protein